MQAFQAVIASCGLSTDTYLDGNFTEGVHTHLHIGHLHASLQYT